MPRVMLAHRAMLLRLTAIVAVGWLLACASIGVRHGDRSGPRGERTNAAAGDQHGRYVDLEVPPSVQAPDDRDDDDDERWKNLQLACILASCCIGDGPGPLPAHLLRIVCPLPPRGPLSPRLRC